MSSAPSLRDRNIGTVFDVFDADGDGFIEQADFTGLIEAAAGVAPGLALAGFQRMDADQDGRISTHEYAAAIGHIFLSQNPADPGTALLGHA